MNRTIRRLLTTILLITALTTTPATAQTTTRLNIEAASTYSRDRSGDALIVAQDGKILLEEGQNGYDLKSPHLLASGTKSFSCALAVAAQMDGLLIFDQRVSDDIPEWRTDPARKDMTIRHLLSQTSGLTTAADLPATSDRYARSIALDQEVISTPGEQFIYAPINFYVFGELMNRKLARSTTLTAKTPGRRIIEYLQKTVFDPLEITSFDIRYDAADNPNLAGGGLMTAHDWLKFGQMILNEGDDPQGKQVLDPDMLAQCFMGTDANPYYGLTFWLQYDLENPVELTEVVIDPPTAQDVGVTPQNTKPQVIIAAGAGQQRLIVIPSLNAVIVRFGTQDRRWSDAAFLQSLLTSD